MNKNPIFFVFVILWLAFGVYLLLPAPKITELPNSLKSAEAGDTWQVSNVSAFYNNRTREQIMDYYIKQFCCSTVGSMPFLTITLNHPPEYARERIRDEMPAWYFEELVHPFRESLYISGWTPALAQLSLGIRYAPLEKNGVTYFQKTTIRQMPTSVGMRLLVYLLMTGGIVSFYVVGREVTSKKLWQAI